MQPPLPSPNASSAETRSAPTAAERAALLGHRGGIIWLTGLSGSGKSTLASGLEQALFRERILTAIIDGDVLRAGLSAGLGFSAEDRHENIRRAAESALLLAETGVLAIVALISPFRADRERIARRARERGLAFAEVFVNASLSECERRDTKSLYKKARAGQIPSFTGIDSPYEVPLSADLELHTDQETPAASIDKLTRFALRLARPAGTPPSGAAGAQG